MAKECEQLAKLQADYNQLMLENERLWVKSFEKKMKIEHKSHDW